MPCCIFCGMEGVCVYVTYSFGGRDDLTPSSMPRREKEARGKGEGGERGKSNLDKEVKSHDDATTQIDVWSRLSCGIQLSFHWFFGVQLTDETV